MSKTYTSKAKDIKKNWFHIDAKGKVVGRLATDIARILRGKHKVSFTPHMDDGDCVVVTGAKDVVFTGRKDQDKMYYRHSGFPGGLKKETAKDLREKYPERILYHAVKGMIPRGPLGRRQLKNLKIFEGDQHTHQAQNPQILEIAGRDRKAKEQAS